MLILYSCNEHEYVYDANYTKCFQKSKQIGLCYNFYSS